MEPLTPTFCTERKPLARLEPVELTRQEKDAIRTKNRIEQQEFKAAAKAKLTEISRGGD